MKLRLLSSRFAAVVAGAIACGAAHAVDFSFNQVVVPPSVAMAGAAPWLNVNIVDTVTPGTVAVTVNANLIGAQTLTGLWFNLPSVSSALSSFALDAGAAGTGGDPFAFAALNVAPTNVQSGISTVQNLKPSGATQAQVGFYNLQLRFGNNGATFQTTESETFNLVANASSGLTAGSFLAQSLQNGGGNPNPPYFALASFTNADGGTGTAGSGIAYIAATVVPVPEPQTYAMTLAGIGLLGFMARRTKRNRA